MIKTENYKCKFVNGKNGEYSIIQRSRDGVKFKRALFIFDNHYRYHCKSGGTDIEYDFDTPGLSNGE